MKKVKVGIDVMGGDFAPLEPIKAAAALLAHPSIHPVLFGDENIIRSVSAELGLHSDAFDIVHAPEVIGMSEHPTKALSQKKSSSISVGFHYLASHQIDAFASAGNTGAMLVGSVFSVKPIQGVIRPTITSVLPKPDGSVGILLDVGANADCKPEVLNQFATLGSLYFQNVLSNNNSAKVGLLSIGEEKEKGNILTQAAYPLLETNERIEFVGNIEGRDIFNTKADVVVCDGFTGNIVLKVCEGMFYNLMKRGIQDEYLNRFNFKHYGGTPVLGVNAPVIIGHGISKSETIIKMMELAESVVQSKMIEKLKASF